jgi:hypothetical protein
MSIKSVRHDPNEPCYLEGGSWFFVILPLGVAVAGEENGECLMRAWRLVRGDDCAPLGGFR